MNHLQTKRFDLFENTVMRPTAMGPMPCILVNALSRDDIFPTLIVASVMLVRMKGKYLLSHLLVED